MSLLLAPHFAGGGASGVVAFVGAPYAAAGVHQAIFSIGAHIITNIDGAGFDVGYWMAPIVGGEFALYEVEAVLFSGAAPDVGGPYALFALNVWFDLGTTWPMWGYGDNRGAAKACELDVTIRRKADLVVAATTRVSLSASGGP